MAYNRNLQTTKGNYVCANRNQIHQSDVVGRVCNCHYWSGSRNRLIRRMVYRNDRSETYQEVLVSERRVHTDSLFSRRKNMPYSEKDRGRVRTPIKETNGDLTQLHYLNVTLLRGRVELIPAGSFSFFSREKHGL